MLQVEHFAPPLEQKPKANPFLQEGLANLIHEQFSPAYTYDRANRAQDTERTPEQTVGKATQDKLVDILPAFSLDHGYTFTKADQIAPGASLDFSPAKPVAEISSLSAKAKAPELHPFLAALKGAPEAVEEKLQTKFAENLRSPLIETRPKENLNIAGTTANFEAENCYQSMQINPNEGWSKTITTLPDLSATRIETRFADKTSSLAYLDHLGRRIHESNFDNSGKLTSLTETLYENQEQPSLATSQRISKDGITSVVSLNSLNKVTPNKSETLARSA
jgi:hypothetical protein